MNDGREIHLEQLLGRRVRDVHGRIVGRIEEFQLAVENGETIIAEFHLGPDALWERLGGAALQLPFVRALSQRARRTRVPWQQVDLSDPADVRLTGA
jgi:sporulation protein YlmC with PRC-barrel domain